MPIPLPRAALAVLLTSMLALGGAGFVACDDDDDEGATLTLGETVRVDGEVEEILVPNAFLLSGEGGIFGDAPEVLVVSPRAVDIEEAEEVEVTGDVRAFVVADVEEEFGIDFGEAEDLVAELEDEAFIVAESIMPEVIED